MTNGILNKLQKGFTLVELLVSMGILAVIFAISTINLSNIIPSTSQTTTLDILISDIRAQQTQAMTTDSSFGVHFEGTSYTLFKGTTYSSLDPANFVVNLDPTVTITNILFPGNQIVFSPGSGNVAGYVLGSDSISLTNSGGAGTKQLKINQYGATY